VMKKLSAIVGSRRVKMAALALLAALTGGQVLMQADAATGNVLAIGQQSFERTPIGWVSGDGGAVWRTRRYASDGRYSLMIAAIGGTWQGRRAIEVATSGGPSTVPVEPGARYAAQFDLRPWADFVDDAACEMRWLGADGSVIGRSTGPDQREVANAWRTYACDGLAPTGARGVSLALHLRGAHRGDVHFLDRASIVRVADALTTTTAAPLPVNLLDPNQHDFEDDEIDGWMPQGNATLDRSTTAAATGDASMLVTASGADPISVDDSQTVRVGTSPGVDGVTVVPGRTYQASVRVNPRDITKAAGRCEMRWYRADGSILDTVGGRSAVLPVGRWSLLSCNAVAPGGAAFGALRVYLAHAPYGTGFFVDDAWFSDSAGTGTGAATVPSGSATTVVAATSTTGAGSTTSSSTISPGTTGGSTTASASTSTSATVPSTTTTGSAGMPPPTDAPSTTRATTTVAPSTTRVTTTVVPTTTRATTTTAAPTTTVVTTTTRPTTTTAAAPPTAVKPGPRVPNPPNVGQLVVRDSMVISDVVVDSIVVHAGGHLSASNVQVNGSVVVLPVQGAATAGLHLANSTVFAGMTVNAIDGAGNLYWGEVSVDVVVSGSWIRHPQGDGSYHTEALAGFGMPRGARFVSTTFVQEGPFNGTATATINWHGADTVFEGCAFSWANGVAAYYTVYVEGRNNVMRNSRLEKGMAGYIYPNSSPPAVYTGNVDAGTGAVVNR
ncbi:MAG: hypothetical protein AB7W59_24220, partial [Acidimicrobiia bacterium]